MVRIGGQPRYADRPSDAATLTEADQSHLAVIVDLDQARRLLVRHFLDRREETHAHIRRIEAAERLEDERFVLGPYRPHEQDIALWRGDALLELLRIGADRDAKKAPR